MSELVKRLREAQWAKLIRQLCNEAADEIERLERELAQFKPLTEFECNPLGTEAKLAQYREALREIVDEFAGTRIESDLAPAAVQMHDIASKALRDEKETTNGST